MKTLASIFFILILASAGFLGVNGYMMQEGSQHVCAASIVLGEDCPMGGSISALLAHHVKAFRSFFQTYINLITFEIIILFALAAFGYVLKKAIKRAASVQFCCYMRHRSDEILETTDRSILRWLSLLEKRDPAISL